jgi:DnaJ-domain-containing protein 1
MLNNKLKGHFLNLYMLALSDNDFDEKELETILQIGEEKGISQKAFEEIIINPTSVEIEYPTSFIDKIKLLYDFTRVIWADKDVADDEKTSFLKFCRYFGFEVEESKELFVWLMDLAKKETPTNQLDNEIKKLTN